MSPKEKIEWFKSACGYMVWAETSGISVEETLANIAHDIVGIAREKDCFAPRLTTYKKYWKG